MIVDVIMPQMGESMAEGTIVRWLKAQGDPVQRDENLVEISTDKVDTEIPAPASGVLSQILAQPGQVIAVGKPIGIIESALEGRATAPEPAKPVPPPAAAPATSGGTAPVASEAARAYSPLVRRIAKEEGLSAAELDSIPGTGQEGRVTKEDVLAYLERRRSVPAPQVPPPAPAVEVRQMGHVRRQIAEHLVRSLHTAAHITLVAEADVSALVRYREQNKDQFAAKEGFKLTYTPFFLQAAVSALQAYPLVNSFLDGDKIVIKPHVNLGVAVALPDGNLIVPVIKRAETLGFTELARSANDVVQRARTKQLTLDDVQDGTFTVTNFGPFGTLFGTPIIHQPQVAILGVGAVTKRAVVVNDAIAIRSLVYLSLACDHRLIDGLLGSQFLQHLVQQLEGWQG